MTTISVAFARIALSSTISLYGGAALAVFKCIDPKGAVSYQNVPCPVSSVGKDLPLDEAAEARKREAARDLERKQKRDAELAERDAKMKTEADTNRDRQAKRGAESAAYEKERDAVIAQYGEWRNALDKVKVGMSMADLDYLHPYILAQSDNRDRTVETRFGITSFRHFGHRTIVFNNGVVTSIHY